MAGPSPVAGSSSQTSRHQWRARSWGPPQATQMIVTGLEDGGANPGQGLSYDFDNELSLAKGGNQSMTFRFALSVSDLLSQSVITGQMLNMAACINAGNPGTFEGQLNVRDTLETPAAIGLCNVRRSMRRKARFVSRLWSTP